MNSIGYYKPEEIPKCKHGLYEVFWTEGGSSLASIGSMHSGMRWMAPCNWTSDLEGGTVCLLNTARIKQIVCIILLKEG